MKVPVVQDFMVTEEQNTIDWTMIFLPTITEALPPLSLKCNFIH